MPNRYTGDSKYKYGFQGQEQDNEIKGQGNSVNYKYRMHDARIGRFFAVDPLEVFFPWNSPYAFSENRVIDAIELEGRESRLVHDLEVMLVYVGKQIHTTRAQLKSANSEELKTDLQNKYLKQNQYYKRIALLLYKEYKVEKYRIELNQRIIDELKPFAEAVQKYGHMTLDGVGLIPFIGEVADGANVAWYLSEGDYINAGFSSAAMVPFLGWGATGSKYLVKLGKEGVEFALKKIPRLQHAFKHAHSIKQFANLTWNKTTRELWKKFNADILTNATKTFDNVLGENAVKGFYKKVDGQDIATYVYAGGEKAGEIATTVVLTAKQMEKFGLK